MKLKSRILKGQRVIAAATVWVTLAASPRLQLWNRLTEPRQNLLVVWVHDCVLKPCDPKLPSIETEQGGKNALVPTRLWWKLPKQRSARTFSSFQFCLSNRHKLDTRLCKAVVIFFYCLNILVILSKRLMFDVHLCSFKACWMALGVKLTKMTICGLSCSSWSGLFFLNPTSVSVFDISGLTGRSR